jgi:hypothetical protein
VCHSCASSLKLRAALFFAARVVRVRVHGGRSRWSGSEVAANRQCAPGALTSLLTAPLTAQPTGNRHGPVIGTTVGPTDRLAQRPEDARVFRCLGLRLWHDGSVHRGLHGDNSRAVCSLPFPAMKDCDIHADGPPQVPHNLSAAGHPRTRGHIMATIWPYSESSPEIAGICLRNWRDDRPVNSAGVGRKYFINL